MATAHLVPAVASSYAVEVTQRMSCEDMCNGFARWNRLRKHLSTLRLLDVLSVFFISPKSPSADIEISVSWAPTNFVQVVGHDLIFPGNPVEWILKKSWRKPNEVGHSMKLLALQLTHFIIACIRRLWLCGQRRRPCGAQQIPVPLPVWWCSALSIYFGLHGALSPTDA